MRKWLTYLWSPRNPAKNSSLTEWFWIDFTAHDLRIRGEESINRCRESSKKGTWSRTVTLLEFHSHPITKAQILPKFTQSSSLEFWENWAKPLSNQDTPNQWRRRKEKENKRRGQKVQKEENDKKATYLEGSVTSPVRSSENLFFGELYITSLFVDLHIFSLYGWRVYLSVYYTIMNRLLAVVKSWIVRVFLFVFESVA